MEAPDVIYLQRHDNPNDDFSWTWCRDQINDDDVEYVRAPATPEPETESLSPATGSITVEEGPAPEHIYSHDHTYIRSDIVARYERAYYEGGMAAGQRPHTESEDALLAIERSVMDECRVMARGFCDALGAPHGPEVVEMFAAKMKDRILRTPAEPPEAIGWQPIETAPKDETAVRLFAHGLIDADFNPTGSVEGFWCDDQGWLGAVWNPMHDYWMALPIEPTHWMPLPGPPLPTTEEA